MNFCENCNYLTDGDVCPVCGKRKHIREVRGEDFCFFVELGEFYFEMLEHTLKENGIDVVGVPFYPMGVTHGNAGRAPCRNVYIRYKDTDAARELYDIVFGTDGE